ncbi:MAG: tRNA-Thr(GGU) m(6)t(6)A37 methyltransferase TsaA [Ancylomarina sp.]|jgi:tRNA-Thr(GGU) m(6)t(6)A37 methyltransferase TsaA
MQEIKYEPIGIIHSEFKEPKGTPIQPRAGEGCEGRIEVFSEFAEGLQDIDGFSHITLVYHFHLLKESSLIVKPFMDDHTHGIFSTRAPSRPNPIGMSVVRLIKVEGNILHVKDMDIVDGTPLLDIKPYVPDIDDRAATKIGWLENNVRKLPTFKDDGRFVE